LRKTGGRASIDAEAGGRHPEGADILLWLEQDDVGLRSKKAAQHHRPTETDRDAHGCSLHLEDERDVRNSLSKPPNHCLITSRISLASSSFILDRIIRFVEI